MSSFTCFSLVPFSGSLQGENGHDGDSNGATDGTCESHETCCGGTTVVALEIHDHITDQPAAEPCEQNRQHGEHTRDS